MMALPGSSAGGPQLDYIGAYESATATGGSYDAMANAGLILSLSGAVNSAIGTYAALQAQKHQLKSEALNAEFRATQSGIAAAAAESEAQQIVNAGRMQYALRGLVEAQDIGATRVSAASRGVVVGDGSAGEVERSQRIAAELDKRALRTNTERAAQAARERRSNLGSESMLARVSAGNMRASAGTLNPAQGALVSTTASAGSLLSQYAAYNSRRR